MPENNSLPEPLKAALNEREQAGKGFLYVEFDPTRLHTPEAVEYAGLGDRDDRFKLTMNTLVRINNEGGNK